MLTITPRDLSCRFSVAHTGKTIGELVKSGAQLNARDSLLEETALHKALKHDMKENILVLVRAGASVDVADAKGDTVLHTAARRCRSIVVWAALLKGKGSNSVIQRL